MNALKGRGWLVSILLLVVLAAAFWMTRPKYGKTSQEGYRYAIALFTACNQQDQAKLERISSMISDAVRAGQIQRPESRWLQAIIEHGRSGDWRAASREVRRLMEDQLERAPDDSRLGKPGDEARFKGRDRILESRLSVHHARLIR